MIGDRPAQPSRARRHRRWLIPAAVSLATAIVTSTSVVAAMTLVNGETESPARAATPRTPAGIAKPALPAPLAGLIIKVPRPCALLSQKTVAALVPEAQPSSDDVDLSAKNGVESCSWDRELSSSDLVASMRRIDISFTLTGKESGGAEFTRDTFADFRRDAAKRANTKEKGYTGAVHTYGPVVPVADLGVDAYAQYRESRSKSIFDKNVEEREGSVTLLAAYLNLSLEIRYTGQDQTSSDNGLKSVEPLPPKTAQDGAVAVAREVVQALNACAECRRA